MIYNIINSNLIISKIKSFINKQLQKKNGHILAVNINSRVGFGANLEWCLEIFMHCELYKLTPYIKLTGNNYISPQRGDDYFEYFFKNPQLTKDDYKYIKNKIWMSKISHINQLGLPENYDAKLTLTDAYKLINKYIRIKKDIVDEVDSFCKINFGYNVLGIHYRGTDKKGEAPRVDWKKVERNVLHYLKRYPQTDSIFISSDEIEFIKYFEGAIKKKNNFIAVRYRDDKYRSLDNRNIHHRHLGEDNYHKGRDALVNCLILSRCNALMKTASILSGWSKLFNPNLPVIMLNKPNKDCLWFPEREIAKQTLYEAVD